jgi:hypothetical protein
VVCRCRCGKWWWLWEEWGSIGNVDREEPLSERVAEEDEGRKANARFKAEGCGGGEEGVSEMSRD